MLLGCNVPKLMSIIIEELKLDEQYKAGECERVFYEFDQLLPEEQEKEDIKTKIAEETVKLEIEQAIQQRKEYIRFFLDEISLHVIDMGIMIFFPHVMKEAYRRTSDIADKLELSCKDRKIIKMKPEMMEILYFDIENPMDDDLLEYAYTKEILIFLWKIGDTDTRAPEEVIKIFYKSIAEPSKFKNFLIKRHTKIFWNKIENEIGLTGYCKLKNVAFSSSFSNHKFTDYRK
jgi:thioredoxin domain-containing protein 3